MRSIWSGSISFGLINIPVKLYSASDKDAFNLDMLHKTDLSPIRYAKICKQEDKEVPFSEIVKGYESNEGDYVVITDKDFDDIREKKSDTIDIQMFTDESEINSIYFEKPYCLEPAKGGNKPYLLLREALKKSGKVAVVKFIMHNHPHIGVIKIFDDTLILIQMRFNKEIRSFEDLKIPSEEKIDAKEVNLAIKLIDQLTDKFKPEKYVDTYAEDLKNVIESKLKGKKLKPAAKKKEPPSKTIDIFSKLQESLKEYEKPKKKNHSSKASKRDTA